MKAFKSSLLLTALVLIVLGVVVIALQPGGPDSECVSKNGPTSGFVDGKKDCAISIESFNKMAEYSSKPKPFRIVGLLMVVAGLFVGVVAVVRHFRSPGSGSSA